MDEVEEQQSQPLCEQINSRGDEFIEDLHPDDEIIEYQNDINLLGNDLKQSTVNSSSYNGPLEPCLGLEFDEVEDARICYNAMQGKKVLALEKIILDYRRVSS